MTEPLPPELRDLIAAEHATPVVSAVTRVAVRAKVAASVGVAPLGHAAAGVSLLGGAKVLAVLALVVGSAAAVHHATRPAARVASIAPSVAATVPLTTTRSEPATIAVAPSVTQTTTPAEAIAVLPRVARARSSAIIRPAPPAVIARSIALATTPIEPAGGDAGARLTTVAAPIATPVASQTELLQRAWAASSAGDGARALALVTEDEQLHPQGVLVEERDALRIDALARLHRADEARAAATQFFQRNPHSIHRAMIERAVGAQPLETP